MQITRVGQRPTSPGMGDVREGSLGVDVLWLLHVDHDGAHSALDHSLFQALGSKCVKCAREAEAKGEHTKIVDDGDAPPGGGSSSW